MKLTTKDVKCLVVPKNFCIFAKEINAYPPLSEYIYTTKWICLVRCVVALSGHFHFL